MRPRQSSLGIRNDSQHGRRSNGCFNEAEAIKPRNPGFSPKDRTGLVQASMRPRQSSLGIAR